MDREPVPKKPRVGEEESNGLHSPVTLSHTAPSNEVWYQESLKAPEAFWDQLAKERLEWIKPYDKVMDVDMNSGDIKWFINGVLNVTVNCLDRHARDNPDRVAVLWEKDEPKQHEPVTYKQLLDMTCQVANVLKSQGIRKGDRVVLYLPMIPLAVAIILACARIGAIHSIVFAGFSAEALSSRIND
uniref:acetate--CoA ligase n=1 Tax=Amphimedon queenslandica TaxID=400682 RepID=A0A1X7SY94_AMPQE